MLQRTITALILFSTSIAFAETGFAQAPTWTLDPFGKEKKPEQFETRTLGSERTATKKFTIPRHFIQNTVTHYNYYFNANNKVNLVVEKSRIAHKDDYSRLLPFYPYTLENTATQKMDLDSVIYTATAGILIHDLRNDWIDNMYLLIGKAYYYRKEFDSAAMTFQFINYNLFPRKKHEEDNKVVGTTSAASGSSISIADKEKRNLIQRAMTLPPSRNDALIWLARTYIEQGEYGDAGGLINTLQNDPNLPKRLRNDLAEVSSYWFFKQTSFDSSASYLAKALSNADDKEDKSRREYLLAQLYEMNHQYDKASEYYLKAAKHTVDPLMDIYARLNNAKMVKGGNAKELDKTIENLRKMAKKDKYETYRDIMYYAAGQISLQKPDTTLALSYFLKSLKYNEDNLPYRNKAFLQLADIAFDRRQYRIAASYYDSVQTSDSTLGDRIAQIEARKSALSKIVEAITNIEKEDSLQRIAAMQPAERNDYIKKLLRRLRKENGLKEDNSNSGSDFNNPFANNNQPRELFPTNTKGEWYFASSNLRSKGFSEFKRNWGNRSNVDNWRRVVVAAPNPNGKTPGVPDLKDKTKGNINNASGNGPAEELSYESLMKAVPLTDEKKLASNESIASNLFTLGKLYQNELEEYQLAVDAYENYLQRFPARLLNGEVYLALYHCYSKLGNKSKADYYKNMLTGKFANTPSGKLLINGSPSANVKNPVTTKRYEQIYDLFIEGNFDAAIAAKKAADIEFGVNYWTPQLLYIEALYNVRQGNDSVAITGLQNIISFYPTSPLKVKAENMIDVLRRRKEIETYLTNLQITRATEDQVTITNDPPIVNKQPVTQPVIKDSVKKLVPVTNGTFTLSLTSPHYVLMILDKVDPVYVNEAKNALARYNNEKFYGQPIVINKDVLDATRSLLIISSFPDANAALQYYGKIRNDAASEMSWLPAAKYSFVIITEENLQLLKTNKDITGYKALLNTQYPKRF